MQLNQQEPLIQAGGLAADAGASAPAPPQPSLVLYGHSSARKEWTRQQKRIFQRLTSWCMEATGRGCQLVRVDLTTANGGESGKLRRHQQELRRRVEREFGFKGVEQFVLETTEGNGVLHMVWAWQGAKSFYIPQDWLSEQWERIHGAPVVWVRKMGLARKDVRAVGRYFAIQYLADQRGALVRASWSWRRSRLAIGKAWEDLKRHASETYQDDTAKWGWRRQFLYTLEEVLQAWDAILRDGQGMLGEKLLEARGRRVVEVF